MYLPTDLSVYIYIYALYTYIHTYHDKVDKIFIAKSLGTDRTFLQVPLSSTRGRILSSHYGHEFTSYSFIERVFPWGHQCTSVLWVWVLKCHLLCAVSDHQMLHGGWQRQCEALGVYHQLRAENRVVSESVFDPRD